MSPRLSFALEIVYDAGRSTLGLFNTGYQVDYKADSSPVTEADRRAEAIVRLALGIKYPGEGVLGEEEGESGPIDKRWVVDPIDGTKSFICGVPLFATLLSYEENGIPLTSAAYFPALDRMFYAERGEGAYCNGRPCQVSKRPTVQKSVICCGSHSSMEKLGKTQGLLNLANQALATRTWGDAFGHSLVASGKAEAMIDPIVKRWDISAMQLIIEEAGGQMTGFNGAKNPQSEAVSTNGLVHSEVLSAFSK
jgi:histidinol phosphatase-like enzyme (inositol monophosphatase family)